MTSFFHDSHSYTHNIHTFISLQCVFIHMVAKRVNLTIEGDLHDKATSYAEEKGMSFSALVAKAISQYMKAGDHTPITPEGILLKMSSEERTGLMRPIVSEMISEFIHSDKGETTFRT